MDQMGTCEFILKPETNWKLEGGKMVIAENLPCQCLQIQERE